MASKTSTSNGEATAAAGTEQVALTVGQIVTIGSSAADQRAAGEIPWYALVVSTDPIEIVNLGQGGPCELELFPA